MTKIMDLHCDTISRIRSRRNEGHICGLQDNRFHVDLKRMKEAGYSLQTFALFTDAAEEESPFFASMELLDIFREEMKKNDDWIRQVITYEDLEKNEAEGKLSALLSVEDGGVSMGLPDILEEYRKAGVRLMTLTWNHENVLAYPNKVGGHPKNGRNNWPDERGLKQKGFETLEKMEELGIILDVSHLSDGGFFDAARVSKKPFIASHSNARAVSSHVRNLTDDMIRVIAERGGLIGLNFCTPFLREGWKPESLPAGGTMEEMLAQLRYLIQVGGEDCIALGSDFDGIEETPEEIPSCLAMPRLAEAMEQNGFTHTEVEKVFSENVRRFLKENL